MKIQIKEPGLLVSEFIKCLERTLLENGITSLDSPSLYFGSSKKVIIAKLKKSEIDHKTREEGNFDLVSF
jgi:hypothetical protein